MDHVQVSEPVVIMPSEPKQALVREKDQGFFGRNGAKNGGLLGGLARVGTGLREGLRVS